MPRLCLASIAALAALAGCDRAPASPAATSAPARPEGAPEDWPGSNLPLVFLDTAGKAIPDEPKIPARLRIARSGELSGPASTDVDFEGHARIEMRGKTSLQFPKKQYGLRLDSPAALLGLPIASTWILYGPYSDKSLIRDDLAYEFSRRMGRYAPRTRFVELFLNDSGAPRPLASHYAGVYMLVERIEVGPDRVAVAGEGSFLMKIDKPDADESPYRTARGTSLIHVSPRTDQAEARAAERFIEDFESALAGPDFENPGSGYPRWIDDASFADYFLLNELFKNVDAYRISTWFHKDHDGKLTMGPVWDFNIALGNCRFASGSTTSGWVSDGIPETSEFPVPFWWKRLLESAGFRRLVGERWKTFRAGPLATPALVAEIARKAELLTVPQERNFERWPILGLRVWPNPDPVPKTWEVEISRLRDWITARAAWMDRELAGY